MFLVANMKLPDKGKHARAGAAGAGHGHGLLSTSVKAWNR